MLDPRANPLYIQVLYDGQERTNIRTLQNHANQKVHDDLTWQFSRKTVKNSDKITGNDMETNSKVCKLPPLKKLDHDIFNYDKPIKPLLSRNYSHNNYSAAQSQRYQVRYSKQSSIYFSAEKEQPTFKRYTSQVIGQFYGNDTFQMPPLTRPVETYKNRSTVQLK